jgi:hypothetical protein
VQPVAAKSAGIVGKWGATSFTSVRVTGMRVLPLNIYRLYGTKWIRIHNTACKILAHYGNALFGVNPLFKGMSSQKKNGLTLVKVIWQGKYGTGYRYGGTAIKCAKWSLVTIGLVCCRYQLQDHVSAVSGTILIKMVFFYFYQF